MAKPFFFRIDLIELMDFATDPEGEAMSLLQFAKELKKGQSNHPAIQKIIDEANNYIEKKKKAGASGGKAKASSARPVLEDVKADDSSDVANPSTPLASNSNSNSNSKEKSNKAGEFILPEWVPVEAWEGFVEMRVKIKKPMTDHAKQLRINDLKKLAESGEDPGAVLDQSTASSWQDLYAVKNKPSPSQPNQNPSAHIPGTPEYKARLNSQLAL